MTHDPTRTRERLAWIILLLSFITCVGLAIGFPLGVRQFVHTARLKQDVLLEPQQGTPRLQRRGRGPVVALVGPTWDVPPGTVVTTDESARSLLTIYAPGTEPIPVATIQIYGGTSMTLVAARSPRFGASPLPHEVILEVPRGRVRIAVTPAYGRSTRVELHTPHMTAVLNEGSFETRVREGESELTVRSGEAQVTTLDGEEATLVSSQRALAQSGPESLMILSAERNLVVNGDFTAPLTEGWEVYHKDVQQEPPGAVTTETFGGRRVARFRRAGQGHAEVGIRQQVNYDVRDFSSLTLHLNVMVLGQSLPGCGSLGSECPIIVRIDYKDIEGTDRTWYHGFYSVDKAPQDLLYPWDEQIPLRTWYSFEGDLIEEFEVPPARIKTIWIYASGWSFDAMVTEVELLAQE
ncbi:MAG TPA: hypothetical protein G4O00_05725 [Thermoflexia bacterium]|jgi:hypothetical protein|nr:hypothetical protein [Thermoflexia bacterium]